MNFFPFMFTEHEWELFGSLGVSEGGVSSHVCSLKKILFFVVVLYNASCLSTRWESARIERSKKQDIKSTKSEGLAKPGMQHYSGVNIGCARMIYLYSCGKIYNLAVGKKPLSMQLVQSLIITKVSV